VQGDIVSCQRRLELTRTVFPVRQYQVLRDFYQEVVSADQLMVVLTRKEEQ
jgi:hypothetical protein